MTKCPKHPKYKGNKQPKNTCTMCLNYYIALGKLIRKPLAPPTRVFPDKTKYSRRVKHKDNG